MNPAQFIPGPYLADGGVRIYSGADNDTGGIDLCWMCRIPPHFVTAEQEPVIRKATTRLLAAAPKLLSACYDAKLYLECGQGRPPVFIIQQLEAALLSALGGDP